MRRLLWLAVGLLLLGASPARADFDSDSRGTAGATFLEFAPSARSAALGAAYAAAAEGAEALFWNPAGLAEGGPTATAFFSEQLLEDGLTYQALAYDKPIGRGAIGLGLEHFSSGQINGTDATGLPTNTFSVSEFAGTLAGAWRFDFPIDVGFAAKYVNSQIATSASTFSMDGGVTWRFRDDWRFSAAARNVGGSLTYDSAGSRLPLEYDIGTARSWRSWLFTADAEFPVDNAPFFAAGVEYRARFTPEWSGAGRLGFNTLSLGDTDGLSNISIGLGASYTAPTGEILSVDYAFIPMGQLGTTNRFTVGLRFGVPELEQKYEQQQRKEEQQQEFPYGAPSPSQQAAPKEEPYPDWGIWVPPPPKHSVPQDLLKPESGAVPTSTAAIVEPLTPPPVSTSPAPSPAVSSAPIVPPAVSSAAVVPPAVSSTPVVAPPAVSSAAVIVPPAVSPAPVVAPTAVSSAPIVPPAVSSAAVVVPPAVSSAAAAVPPAVSSAPAVAPTVVPAAPVAAPPAVSSAPAVVPPAVSSAPAQSPPPPPKPEAVPLLPLPN